MLPEKKKTKSVVSASVASHETRKVFEKEPSTLGAHESATPHVARPRCGGPFSDDESTDSEPVVSAAASIATAATRGSCSQFLTQPCKTEAPSKETPSGFTVAGAAATACRKSEAQRGGAQLSRVPVRGQHNRRHDDAGRESFFESGNDHKYHTDDHNYDDVDALPGHVARNIGGSAGTVQ
ncbi:hypothetical protein MRX96_012178 [Rhipicephalus microplus]